MVATQLEPSEVYIRKEAALTARSMTTTSTFP